MAELTKEAIMKERIRRERARRQQSNRKPLSAADVTGMAIQNLPKSAWNLLGDIGSAAANPIQTGIDIGKMGVGAAQLMIPGEQGLEPRARAVGQHFKERYGGWENIKRTIAEDPAGFGLDVASILAPVGAARSLATQGRKARKQFVEDAPTAKDIKAEGDALYKQARDLDIDIDADTYSKFIGDLDKKMKGLDPVLHPRMARVVELTKGKADTPMNLAEMDTIRKQLGMAAEDITNPSQARLAKKAQGILDDFVEGIGGEAGSKYGQARKAWARMRKTELVENAIKKAADAASGFENGLRIEFRKILNSDKKRRGFTKDEIGAMREVVRGNFSRNVMRRLGKFSFGSGAQGSNLLATLGVGGGAAVGGPVGAMAIPTVGHMALKGAERGTKAAADLARARVASGTGVPASSSPNLLAPASPLLLQAAGMAQPSPLIPSANPLLPR